MANKDKIGISIDSTLLEETYKIAQELDIPRSQVISLALEEFNKRYRNRQIFAQINEAFSDGPDSDENGTKAILHSQLKKLGEHGEWK